MFKGGKLSPEKLEEMRIKDGRGGKEKKRAMLTALRNLDVGEWIDVEDTYYTYPSVRARVSELMAQLDGVKFKTTRVPFNTRVYRLA